MTEEPTPLEEAKIAVRKDSAGHWPTVAAILLEEVERLEEELKEAKNAIRDLVAITEDISNGKDVGNRLIVAWNVADEILKDNANCAGTDASRKDS